MLYHSGWYFIFLVAVQVLGDSSISPIGPCPPWASSIASTWLEQHPDEPGVQFSLFSPRCKLNCVTSIRSTFTNYTNEPPLLPESPWRIMSVTKPFTAAAVLQLAQQKLVDLHAPVENYIPGWASSCLQTEQGVENASLITSWMLLHHTSGLDDYGNDPRFQEQLLSNTSYHWTQKTILEWAATHQKPIGAPGETFHYSSTGYTYLGLVIENVTGYNLGESVRKLDRLDDLHMPSTWWEILEPAPADTLPIAGQYYGSIDATGWDQGYASYGGGGLVSNSEDLNKFTSAIHEGRLLDRSTMDLLYSTVPAPSFGASYGCGWFNSSIGEQQAWWHTGSSGGWTVYIQSLDLVFSGTINQNANSPRPLMDQFVQGLIQEQPCQPKLE